LRDTQSPPVPLTPGIARVPAVGLASRMV